MVTPTDWKTYYESAGTDPSPACHIAINKHMKDRRGAALDIGAGNLRNSVYLSSIGFSPVIAIDPEAACEQYRAPGVDLRIQSIDEYVPKSGSFDVVLATNVICYLGRPSVEKMLRRIRKALRPDGVFVFNLVANDDERALEGTIRTSFSHNEMMDLTWKLTLAGVVPLDAADDTSPAIIRATGEKIAQHTWTFICKKVLS